MGQGISGKKRIMETQIFRRFRIFGLSLIVGVFISTLVIVCVPFLICRQLISYLAILLRSDFDGIVELKNACFLPKSFWEKSNLAVISKCLVKGRPTADHLKEQFANKIYDMRAKTKGRYSRLQQYPYNWMGYYFWKWEDNFNINDHIFDYRCEKLSNNPNYRFSEKELKEIEDEIYLTPFTKDKSLWEFTVVPYGKSEESGEDVTLVYFRINHSMGDGYSIVMLWVDLLFGNENSEKELQVSQKLGTISWKLKLLILIKTIVFGFYDLTESLSNLNPPNVWRAMHHKENEKIIYSESKTLSLEMVKEISKIHNVGVTAVMYSAVTSALRKALMKNVGSVPKTWCSSIAFPICDRPLRLTNHLTFDFIPLPVGESDSVKRLKMIHTHICRAKASTFQFLSFYLLALFMSPFSFITQYSMEPKFTPRAVSATSLPTKYFTFKPENGVEHELQTSSFACTLGLTNSYNPIGFSSLSHNSRIKFVAAGHNSVFTAQDMEDVMRFIEEEFDILKRYKQ